MKLLTIVWNTLYESIKRVTLLIYLVIGTIIMVTVAIGLRVGKTDGKMEMLSIFGNDIPIGNGVIDPSAVIFLFTIGGSLTGMMLFGMFATAGIIPAFLKRGTIDIYLSKPISRLYLLFSKYLGGVTTIGAALLYFFLGMFLIIGFKTGYWNSSIVYVWLLSVLLFASVYAMASFLAVISRSIGVVLIFVYLHLFILSDIIISYRDLPLRFLQTKAAEVTFSILYYVLPQTQLMVRQIMGIFERQVTQIQHIESGFDMMPFFYSALSGVFFFLLAYLKFSRTDY
jgi:ABC-type transport system involved in multi-copper enzyme maturation permease subunit